MDVGGGAVSMITLSLLLLPLLLIMMMTVALRCGGASFGTAM